MPTDEPSIAYHVLQLKKLVRELEAERDAALADVERCRRGKDAWYRKGVREGIERVRAEGMATVSLTCDLALAAFEAEGGE